MPPLMAPSSFGICVSSSAHGGHIIDGDFKVDNTVHAQSIPLQCTGVKLFITAKTRAKEARIEELDPIHLLVSVKEPPVEGKANRAIIKLLAHHFGVPQASVRIIIGLGTKEKVVEVLQK